MQEIIISNNTEVKAVESLQTSLFNDFISFVDRGEKTTKTYINNLKQFAAWLRYSMIDKPIRSDIINYREYLTAEHEAIQLDPTAVDGWSYRTKAGKRYTVACKPNTVVQYLRSVCQFFRWTAANGFYPNIAENIHAPKIRHDNHHKEALEAADVKAIEENILLTASASVEQKKDALKDTAGQIQRAGEQGKRLYAMYLLAVNAGLRTVELSRASVKDLEVKNGNAYLYVWGKGHSEADSKKPLAPEVYAAIKDYLECRTDRPTGNSPLFVSTGNRSGGKRIATTTISTMLKKAMKQAGYDSERITAHSLRHTAGTAVQEITGDLYTTQKYMRHSNPATTEIYLHNDTANKEMDVARQLYSFYQGETCGDDRQQLEQIVKRMSADQLRQLTNIAVAMAR